MKILVCISKVPDTTTKITFTDDNTRFNSENVQFIVNPYDEWYALVRGLELKETHGGTVTVIHVGHAENDPIIRKALAIGADDAVRINADPVNAYFTAFQIAEFARDQGYDLILAGKETIDYNGSGLGGMIAELLDLPYISLAASLDLEGDSVVFEREIEGGKEVCETTMPCVVSAMKGMAEQRIPNMRGIMAARTKPLQVVEPVDCPELTGVNRFELPPEKGECRYIDPENPAELLELLHNEAKVI